jgi:chaperonin GroEL
MSYHAIESNMDSNLEKVLAAFQRSEDVVCSTMGPYGQDVLIFGQGKPTFSGDGVTVMRHLAWKEPLDKVVAELLIDAAQKTLQEEGDGTTTTILLSSRLAHELLPAIQDGADRYEVAEAMVYAMEKIASILQDMATPITTEKMLQDVCTIAANNDPELGKLIGSLAFQVGKYGTMVAVPSRKFKTEVKKINGWLMDSPGNIPFAPDFIEDTATRSTELINPRIVLIDFTVSDFDASLNRILQYCVDGWNKGNTRPLVLFVEGMDGAVLPTLVTNYKKGMPIYVLRAPFFGEHRDAIMEDMRILTNSNYIFSRTKGRSIKTFNPDEDFGECAKLTFYAHRLIIEPSQTDVALQDNIQRHKAKLVEAMDVMEMEESHLEFYKLRIARLDGGIGFIFVGGQTSTEQESLFMIVDDAQRAAFAAWKNGVVPGGGASMIRAGEKCLDEPNRKRLTSNIGLAMVHWVLKTPFSHIAKLAGLDEATIDSAIAELRNSEEYKDNVFCLKRKAYVNAFEIGIIEPVGVPIAALRNAVSIVKHFVTTKILLQLTNG